MKVIGKSEIENFQGYEAEPTNWHLVTQDQINVFADATLDHQYIHTDPAEAKQSAFGGVIAHGFLSLSMLSYFYESFGLVIEGTSLKVNYGFDSVRFISPVKVNSRIRAHAKTMDIYEKKPAHFMVKTAVEIEIEGESKPALTANWLTMLLVK